MTNLRACLVSLLLLMTSNTCLVFADDHDFWQSLNDSRDDLEQRQRSRRRRDEELKRIEEDNNRDHDMRRRRPLLFGDDKGKLNFEMTDGTDKDGGDLQARSQMNQDDSGQRPRGDLNTKLTVNVDQSLPNTLPEDDRDLGGSSKADTQTRQKDRIRDLSAARGGNDDASQLDDDRRRADKEWRNLIKAQDQLNDWVPAKPDTVNNGGFGLAPDDGRPVPYKLNGHIEIERGLPWEKGN